MRVVLTPGAVRQLDRLPLVIKVRTSNLFRRLDRWPAISGAKPLSGNYTGWFRMRIGDYRLRFHIEGDVVLVDKIGHRDGFYDD